jgi:hypothetical protein
MFHALALLQGMVTVKIMIIRMETVEKKALKG